VNRLHEKRKGNFRVSIEAIGELGYGRPRFPFDRLFERREAGFGFLPANGGDMLQQGLSR